MNGIDLQLLVLGTGTPRTLPQLFFDACAVKPINCGLTLVPLHVGHFGLAFSRSAMVMISSLFEVRICSARCLGV